MTVGMRAGSLEGPRQRVDLGRKATYPAEVRQLLVRKTTRGTPPGQTHWSRTTMAKAMDLSPSTVGRVWREHGLKPHLLRTFKVSNDPLFAEKLEDIVGLYLAAPEHAIVLCCDEKSQVQALDRTQPGLPLKKGRARTLTHDYEHHRQNPNEEAPTIFCPVDTGCRWSRDEHRSAGEEVNGHYSQWTSRGAHRHSEA